MTLIVGLGNPGPEHKNTPHNIGFQVLNAFQKENGFPDFTIKKRFEATMSQGIIEGKKVLLAKPQTFMNKSGQSVGKIVFSTKRLIGALFIIHDDLGLPLGKIKLCFSKGSGGHKGVQSIIKELGTNQFYRLRIGTANLKTPIINYQLSKKDIVLRKFKPEDQKIINQAVKTACQALKLAIVQGPEKAMTQFN